MLTSADVAASDWGYDRLREHLAGHPERRHPFATQRDPTTLSEEAEALVAHETCGPELGSAVEGNEASPREFATEAGLVPENRDPENPEPDSETLGVSRYKPTPQKRSAITESREESNGKKRCRLSTSPESQAAQSSPVQPSLPCMRLRQLSPSPPARKGARPWQRLSGSIAKSIETSLPCTFDTIRRHEFFDEEKIVTWLLRFILYQNLQGSLGVELVLELGPHNPIPEVVEEVLTWLGEDATCEVVPCFQLRAYAPKVAPDRLSHLVRRPEGD